MPCSFGCIIIGVFVLDGAVIDGVFLGYVVIDIVFFGYFVLGGIVFSCFVFGDVVFCVLVYSSVLGKSSKLSIKLKSTLPLASASIIE